MSIKQNANPELVEILTPEFQRRNEPNFAFPPIASSLMGMGGMRGLWMASGFDSAGNMTDFSGLGHHMTINGDPVYNQIAPIAQHVTLDGTGDYFYLADHADFDITGTESFVAGTRQGLTIGGWFRFDSALGAIEYMVSKWNTATNNRSYTLRRTATGTVQFSVSNDGTAVTSVETVGIPPINTWFFAAGRFSNSENLIEVWYNLEAVETAFANTIHSGSARVTLGATSGGSSLLTGRISAAFICAMRNKRAVIFSLYQNPRPVFEII